MSEKLKPVRCGCGGEAQYEAYENYNFGSYIAHIMICDKCGMRTAEWPSEAEAIEAWNRRAEQRQSGRRRWLSMMRVLPIQMVTSIIGLNTSAVLARKRYLVVMSIAHIADANSIGVKTSQCNTLKVGEYE